MSSLCNLEICMFHLLISHILIPCVSSLISFFHFDAILMLNIKYHIHTNLPSMILIHLCSSSSYDVKVTLLYGMYLTKVFCHFEVDFSSEETSTFHHPYFYTHESYTRMVYMMDDFRKMYHNALGNKISICILETCLLNICQIVTRVLPAFLTMMRRISLRMTRLDQVRFLYYLMILWQMIPTCLVKLGDISLLIYAILHHLISRPIFSKLLLFLLRWIIILPRSNNTFVIRPYV